MLLMMDYSGPEYKGLYEEILLDYHYRFPKFHPIPYPFSFKSNDTNQQQPVRKRP
jgi:hypothetical protein